MSWVLDEGLALCAPDKGARDFVKEMFTKLELPKARFLLLDKERTRAARIMSLQPDQRQQSKKQGYRQAEQGALQDIVERKRAAL